MNILLVEDEDNLRSELAFYLEMEGHHVKTASDGMSAWEMLGEYTLDVVITDLKMPRMNGLELIKLIRGSDSPNLPIIVTSAYSQHEWVNDVETLGVSEYLLKPFNLEHLAGTLVRVENKIDKNS